MSGNASWNEWGQHVLEELKRLSKEQAETRQEVEKLREDVSFLRGRAAGFGALMGLLVSLIMLGLKWIWSLAGHH